VLLFVIFMTEVAGGVAGYVMQKDIDVMLRQRMDKSMDEYTKNMEITNSWNVLQYDVSEIKPVRYCNVNPINFAL
jgi:3-hydroxy-3-methylglutaryl CoA synthase